MMRRRFQNPKPFRRGEWWCLLTWEDVFHEGKLKRKRKWHKLGPATMLEREASKIAAEIVRPINQGLVTPGSAIPFGAYVTGTYRPTVLPLLATTTQSSYECTLRKYLMPVFEQTPLREMTTITLQRFFSGTSKSELSGDTILKIKETLSSVLGSAVLYELLTKNPVLAVEIPRSKRVNKRKPKPHITPEEFLRLVELVAEPYSTMIYTAVFRIASQRADRPSLGRCARRIVEHRRALHQPVPRGRLERHQDRGKRRQHQRASIRHCTHPPPEIARGGG